MLTDLGYVVVYVDDLDRCAAFYRDVLGIPVDYAAPGWTQFKTRGAALVLHPKTDPASPTGTAAHVTFRVDDLDAEYRRLSAQAVKFVAPPASAAFGKHATLLDPEGNAVDLIEWVRPGDARRAPISDTTVVNDILMRSPEAMEVLESHVIRICGGCIVLLNATVRETAEYSGLSGVEASALVEELNNALLEHPVATQVTP